jgi:hypothetical protein
MFENGTVARVPTDAGGLINPVNGGAQVSYSGRAVEGTVPNVSDPVCFKRTSRGSTTASVVRFGSCAMALAGDGHPGGIASTSLEHDLESAFRTAFAQMDGAMLSEDGQTEVSRMSAERAARIQRPLRKGKPLPDNVKAARLSLAMSAMSLMATEAAVASDGEITAESLQRVLRGQRPPLSRKPKP